MPARRKVKKPIPSAAPGAIVPRYDLPLEVRMAGQVVLRLGEPNNFEAWVIDGRHKPVLSVPLSSLNEITPLWHEDACTYLDTSGEQYAMLDITGYEIWVNGTPDDSKGSPYIEEEKLKHVINLPSDFVPRDVSPEKTKAVASVLKAWGGELAEAAVSKLKAKDDTDSYVLFNAFDDYVASQVVLAYAPRKEHVVKLAGRSTTYTLSFSGERLAGANTPVTATSINLYLTTLCGWNGSYDSRIDFEDGKAIYPGFSGYFDRRYIRYYGGGRNPRTGTCPPKTT